MRTFFAGVAGIALAATAGCGIFDDSEWLSLETQMPVSAVDIKTDFIVVNGGRSFVVRHDDMKVRVAPNVRNATVPVEKAGTLKVSFVQTKSATDTIASGEVELPMGEDYEYAVRVHRMPAGMPSGCFGCTGERTFPLRGSEQQSTDVIVVSYVARVPCKDCVY